MLFVTKPSRTTEATESVVKVKGLIVSKNVSKPRNNMSNLKRHF